MPIKASKFHVDQICLNRSSKLIGFAHFLFSLFLVAAEEVLPTQKEPPDRLGGHTRREGSSLRGWGGAGSVEHRRHRPANPRFRYHLSRLCRREARESDASEARHLLVHHRLQKHKAD